MMTKIHINQMLDEMAIMVTDSRSGHLELGYRLRLWGAMEMEYGELQSQFRRNVLSLLVAERASSNWDSTLIAADCEYADLLNSNVGSAVRAVSHSPKL